MVKFKILHALSYYDFWISIYSPLYSYQGEKGEKKKRKEKEEKRWNITNSGLYDFMGSGDLRLVMENKIPGERSRSMELFGARARKVED